MFLQKLLLGLVKGLAEWCINKIIEAIDYWQSVKKHNNEIDELVEKQKDAAKAAKENPTDENKQKLIDAARNLIRKSDGL